MAMATAGEGPRGGRGGRHGQWARREEEGDVPRAGEGGGGVSRRKMSG